MSTFHTSGGDILTSSGFVIRPDIARQLLDQWSVEADHYAHKGKTALAYVYRELARDMTDAITSQSDWLRASRVRVFDVLR